MSSNGCTHLNTRQLRVHCSSGSAVHDLTSAPVTRQISRTLDPEGPGMGAQRGERGEGWGYARCVAMRADAWAFMTFMWRACCRPDARWRAGSALAGGLRHAWACMSIRLAVCVVLTNQEAGGQQGDPQQRPPAGWQAGQQEQGSWKHSRELDVSWLSCAFACPYQVRQQIPFSHVMQHSGCHA